MSGTTYELHEYRDALNYLDPNVDRDTWHRYGSAGIAAGLSVGDVNEWSSKADNYAGEKDVNAAFKTIKQDGKITAGTLIHFARQAGWEPANKSERATSAPAPAKPPTRAVKPPAKPRPGMSAAEVWERSEPATAEHGYIARKKGEPDELRVLPGGDPLTIGTQKQRMAGALVVPVYLLDGTLSTLQFIPPAAGENKMNLPGASLGEGFFTVGTIEPKGIVYLCEGIGQAWACNKAMGHAAVVCFSWGRVGKVAAELRKHYPSAHLVIVPDVGKEREAEVIAREVGGSFVELPEGSEQNSGVDDYALREGADQLEELLSKVEAPAIPEPRFKLLGSADLRALPPLEWRVRGVLPAWGVAGLYGPSGSGKSFLALDVAAAIASGEDWFGYRVKPAPVVYCALEGEGGFRLRVAAWEKENGGDLPDGLRLVLQSFKLTEARDVLDLAGAVLREAGPGAVTILDTLNRAAPQADENSSADMGGILEAVKELQRLTGGLVVLVHHTGKDATKGLRGHSSLFAALDAAVEVTRDGDRRAWRVAKAKDGADGEVHPFRLSVVDLGLDDEDEAVTSCVVRTDTAIADIAKVRLPKGGNQRIIFDALRPLFTKSGVFGKAGAPTQRPCITLEEAIEQTRERLPCEPDRKTNRTRQAITGLITSGILGFNEEWLWVK